MSLRSVLHRAAPVLLLVACADDDDASRVGSAVGLRARVQVGGDELLSAEAEVRLDPSGAADSAAPRTGLVPVRPQLAGPHMHAAAPQPGATFGVPTPPASAACNLGKPATQIGTINGSICWVSSSLSSGAFIEENAVYKFAFFGREGIYHATQVAMNVYYPPDFGHFGAVSAVGCARSPDGDFITTDYLASMSAFAVSYGIGPFTTGFTTFIVPGRAFVPAIEYDSGYGLTASLIPWPIAIGLNLMEKSNFTTPPTLVVPWNKDCTALDAGPDPQFRAGGDGTLATIAAGLHGLMDAGGDDELAALRVDMAAALLPVFDLLAAPSGVGPTDDAPAASQADLFTDFLARGDGTALCSDCPALSLDHLIYEFDRQVKAAGDDSDAILAAGTWAADRQLQISPQMLVQTELQRQLGPGVALAGVIADEVVAAGAADRYVDARVVSIPAEIGAPADLSIDAAEIADLLGVDAVALAGATVTIDASPVIDPASFPIVDDHVQASFTPEDPAPLLFRYAVDLSTAVGPLPAGAATWVVRPAMRRIEPASGPPAHLLLTAPFRVVGGEPVLLSAMALDADFSPVNDPITVDFLDGAGAVLATVAGPAGAAEAAVTLTPTLPEIAGVTPTTLVYGDSSTGPGFAVAGAGFSREAVLMVDGASLQARGLVVAVMSSQEILFADDGSFAGQHRLVVENPHGTTSTPATFTGP